MSSEERVFLIGPMGAGKSAVGQVLAQRLGRRFLDSDRVLEERTGVDIARIFDVEGEVGFRAREEIVLQDLTRHDGVVLATGGGAVLRERNRVYLRERGLTVYLRTSIDTQLIRTRHSNRPLLQTEDPRARLQEVMLERAPLYETLADITVDTDHGTIAAIVDEIIQRLGERVRA
ncbi:shikimate kinase AroK [Nitrococcus mobilis]|uniref:Shikimate kinase n=1 Tax=Nitrococcus mobilis Nb-231 TaxID=314278 RepID=A4BQU9_9GAMM|nr:shikimate kinase AroK [Nitrococcus mobilis]EAR21949.1 shikimate kinase I [Nitrococcus mobilis Nb-231]